MSLSDVSKRRRDAVQTFLEENAALFSITEEEKTAHAEGCEDAECVFLGASYLDGWLLVTRLASFDDPDYELNGLTTSTGLTDSRCNGLLDWARSL